MFYWFCYHHSLATTNIFLEFQWLCIALFSNCFVFFLFSVQQDANTLYSTFHFTKYSCSLKACDFIKKRLQHTCFRVRFGKFLWTPILKNICERLLLKIWGFPFMISLVKVDWFTLSCFLCCVLLCVQTDLLVNTNKPLFIV